MHTLRILHHLVFVNYTIIIWSIKNDSTVQLLCYLRRDVITNENEKNLCKMDCILYLHVYRRWSQEADILYRVGVHKNIIIIGDLSETHWRPTCLIGDPSGTNLPDRRWTQGKIRISHGSPMRNVGVRWVSDEACLSPMGYRAGFLVSNGSPIRLVGFRWGILVFDGSTMRHVGLRWVSDEACQSLMGLGSGMVVSNGSTIWDVGLLLVTDRCPMGFRWVSDGSPIDLR